MRGGAEVVVQAPGPQGGGQHERRSSQVVARVDGELDGERGRPSASILMIIIIAVVGIVSVAARVSLVIIRASLSGGGGRRRRCRAGKSRV